MSEKRDFVLCSVHYSIDRVLDIFRVLQVFLVLLCRWFRLLKPLFSPIDESVCL